MSILTHPACVFDLKIGKNVICENMEMIKNNEVTQKFKLFALYGFDVILVTDIE